MDVWVVSNPGPNAVGCPHPRPNPAEGRVDLQLDAFSFAILTEDEWQAWQLSPGFKKLKTMGLVAAEKTSLEAIPMQKPQIPDDLKPDGAYDHQTAYQIALAPEQTEDTQLARINLFRSDEPNRLWHPEADMTYLKTRHLGILRASKWYLEEFLDKRTPSQNRRLKDIKRQLKAIETLV